MTVLILQATDYDVLMRAIRTSHDSHEHYDTYLNALGYEDTRLLKKIINLKHDSVLEHMIYTLWIKDISRALLQQLVRHRHISFTVQSTRYTLKKTIDKAFNECRTKQCIVRKLCVLPPSDAESLAGMINELYDIFELIRSGKIQNDIAKTMLPECFKTSLVMTTNARELLHIIKLRSQPEVYWEFQILAKELFGLLKARHPQLWGWLAERENIQLEVEE